MGEPLIRKWFSLTADRLGEAKWQNLRHIQQVTDWVRKVNLVREVIKAGPSALVTDNAPNPRIRPRVIGLSLSHLFTGYVYRCDPNRIHYSPREAARLSMPRQKPSIRARGPWLVAVRMSLVGAQYLERLWAFAHKYFKIPSEYMVYL